MIDFIVSRDLGELVTDIPTPQFSAAAKAHDRFFSVPETQYIDLRDGVPARVSGTVISLDPAIVLPFSEHPAVRVSLKLSGSLPDGTVHAQETFERGTKTFLGCDGEGVRIDFNPSACDVDFIDEPICERPLDLSRPDVVDAFNDSNFARECLRLGAAAVARGTFIPDRAWISVVCVPHRAPNGAWELKPLDGKLTIRIERPPPPYLTSPQGDIAIRTWCGGRYEHAYVIFHPFIGTPDKTDRFFEQPEFPDRRAFVTQCRPVSWAEVEHLAACGGPESINWYLLSSIGGVRDRASDERVTAFLNTLESAGVFRPSEGNFPPLLFDQFVTSLGKHPHDLLILSEEFGDCGESQTVMDLLDLDNRAIFFRNLYTPDRRLHYTVHWDSHFSILCGPRDEVNAIVERFGFEGFPCDETTTIAWYKPAPQTESPSTSGTNG